MLAVDPAIKVVGLTITFVLLTRVAVATQEMFTGPYSKAPFPSISACPERPDIKLSCAFIFAGLNERRCRSHSKT